jgi:hypothetical protein
MPFSAGTPDTSNPFGYPGWGSAVGKGLGSALMTRSSGPAAARMAT